MNDVSIPLSWHGVKIEPKSPYEASDVSELNKVDMGLAHSSFQASTCAIGIFLFHQS